MLSRKLIAQIFRSAGSHHAASHASNHSIPEGSWHRHSDDEDPYYYYNKYGPFHVYTHLNHCRPADPHNTFEEDPYRNEVQGYLYLVDPSDNRRNAYRGIAEGLLAISIFCIGLAALPTRHHAENDYFDKKMGDALLTAQEIELFIQKVKQEQSE